MYFGGSGPMFTWSVRVGCKLPACRGESVKYQTCFKYQTCLIFLQPLPTLISDPNFNPLATGLSVKLRPVGYTSSLHFLSRYHLQACHNM